MPGVGATAHENVILSSVSEWFFIDSPVACILEGMGKSQRIELTREQREQLERLIRAGKASARKLARARILLLSDSKPGGWQSAPAVAKAVLVHPNTVRNVRRRFVSEGLEAALEERPRPGAKPKLTGEIEAQLSRLACSQPPEGHSSWSLRLLAEKLVEVTALGSVHHDTVGEWLKKTRSSPGA
jgi:transposase